MLRYDNYGRPIGLDWTVCNDGNPRPEVWSNWRPPKKARSGRTRRTVNHGVGRGGVHKFSPEKDARIVKMYTEDQMAAYKIAEAIGSTPKTIWRVLRRNNIPKRTNSMAQTLRWNQEIAK